MTSPRLLFLPKNGKLADFQCVGWLNMNNEELTLFLKQNMGEGIPSTPDVESINRWVERYFPSLEVVPGNIEIHFIKKEFFFSIRMLLTLANSSDELIDALAKFLRYRAILIQDQPYDYFQFPQSPMNQLCIRLVEALATEEQDLLSLLLGRSLVKNYPVASATLREFTETIVNGKRKLNLEGYLLNADKTAIIPFTWFHCHPDKTSPNMNYFHLDDNDKLIPMVDKDLAHLEALFGEESKALFNQFNYYKALSDDDKTLYSLFIKLIDQLKTASTANDRDPSVYTEANEYVAANNAQTAIDQFFNVWKHCPKDLKTKILELRERKYNPLDHNNINELEFNRTHPSVREYFLVLRGQLEEDDPELENQAQIRRRVTLLYCTDVISSGLRSIVAQNKEAFVTTLNGIEIQAEDYQDCLTRLHEKITQTPPHLINYPKDCPYSAKNCLFPYIHQLVPKPDEYSDRYQITLIDQVHYLIAILGQAQAIAVLQGSETWNMRNNELLKDSLLRDGEKMTAFLVSHGINIHTLIADHDTVTHIAVKNDWQFLIYHLTQRRDHIKYLLHRNDFDLIPLDYALRSGKLNIIQLLLKRSAANQLLTRSAGRAMLFKILETRNLTLIRSVLTHPVWNTEDLMEVLNWPIEDGETALEICINSNAIEIAKLLIEYHDSSDFYQINENVNSTPIHSAIKLKRTEILEELIEAQNQESDETGATVKDYDGNTPLHLAVLAQDSKIFNIVLDLGDEAIFIKNNARLTPIQLALKINNHEAITGMINHLISSDYPKTTVRNVLNKSHGDITVLNYLINKNNPEMINTLTQHGFHPCTQNNQSDDEHGTRYNKRLRKM